MNPAPAFAVGEPVGPRSTSESMSGGTGPSLAPVENCTSASWTMPEAPLFAVMSSRKCRYSATASAGMSYDFVWNRSAKVSPARVSRVFQSLPSVEPLSVQSLGSRSAASLAEVSA